MQDFKYFRKIISKNILFMMILVLLLVGISDRIVNLMIANDSYVSYRNKSIFRILREKENSVDVIVLGDSLSMSSISPMIWWNDYGMTGYVCGQTGQRMQEAFHMLQAAYETQNPRLVILETNMVFRCKNLSSEIKDCLGEIGYRYIPIFQGHDIWKSVLSGKQYSAENYKGFAFRGKIAPYEQGEYMQKTEQKEEISKIVSFYMEKIRKLCEKNGTKLLLVSTPSPINCNYARHNSIEAYAREKGLDFLDLNMKTKEIGIDWKTDSLDGGDHLNCSGADKVTRYLEDYMNVNYFLPDHRGENAYCAWDEEYELYERKAAQELKAIREAE